MILKLRECCTRFGMVAKTILQNQLIDDKLGFQLTLYIDTVAIWYCPYCGLEVNWRMV